MSTILLPITTTEQGLFVVSTLDFAEGLTIQHASLMSTIQNYLPAIEKDFGQVRFEIGTVKNSVGAVNQIKFARLTEDQALFIGSLSRNSERVVEFKSVLVRSFAAVRAQLATQSLPSYQIENPIDRAKRWIEEEKQRQVLLFENAELKPKAEYAEAVLLSTTELTTTLIAQNLGMTAQALNKLLKAKGVQFKQSGIWNLTRAYNGKGYAKLRTFPYTGSDGRSCSNHLLVWTEVGRQFIHELVNPILSPALATA